MKIWDAFKFLAEGKKVKPKHWPLGSYIFVGKDHSILATTIKDGVAGYCLEQIDFNIEYEEYVEPKIITLPPKPVELLHKEQDLYGVGELLKNYLQLSEFIEELYK